MLFTFFFFASIRLPCVLLAIDVTYDYVHLMESLYYRSRTRRGKHKFRSFDLYSIEMVSILKANAF